MAWPISKLAQVLDAADATILKTVEAMTIPIDYNGGSVGDPPSGTLFVRQADVDKVLADNGWTAFKHIEPVYNALPENVDHVVTFELVAGQHRAFNNGATTGYLLDSKIIGATGGITFIGPLPSQWPLSDVSLTGLSIIAQQVGSGDPWLQFSGTPFNGFDLKGHFALLSTGQLAVIHDHTDDTLYLLNALSPNPVGGTVDVKIPATTIVNYLDDGITLAGTVYMASIDSRNTIPSSTLGIIRFENVGIDFSGTGNVFSIGGGFRVQNVRMFGTGTGNQIIATAKPLHYLYVYNFVSHGAPTVWSPFIIYGEGRGITRVNLYYAYLRGPTVQETAFQDTSVAFFYSVIESGGNSNDYGILTLQGSYIDFFRGSGGKYPELRNASGPPCALALISGSTVRNYGQHLLFKNCSKPCVRVSDSVLDLSLNTGSDGFYDGGGNTDVGVELVGPQAFVRFNQITDVSGALGDVRLSSGDIVDYATIKASPGGLIDESFNRIEVV